MRKQKLRKIRSAQSLPANTFLLQEVLNIKSLLCIILEFVKKEMVEKQLGNAVESHWLCFTRKVFFKVKTRRNNAKCSTNKENVEIERGARLRSLMHYCSKEFQLGVLGNGGNN